MVKIRLIVTGFASHQTWAEGFERAACCKGLSGASNNADDDIRLNIIPGDRWKFRMMAAAAELEELIATDDDIVVVDAMIDVTVLVALLKSNRPPHQCPKSILLYFHENQLTTPFTNQDRDQKHQTHWHYGMAHWRSLLVADGFLFNSQTHLDDFSTALPKLINEQCPRDTVEWQLTKCRELLASKCTVLRYGLELEELSQLGGQHASSALPNLLAVNGNSSAGKRTPVLLWNARLEDDKDPNAFIELLKQIPETTPFELIILGTDPSKGQKWYATFQQEFGDRILYIGWCKDRSDYAGWLCRASIVVSTAIHETFGISIVESVYCGALPLLPNRLSYPELFSSMTTNQQDCFYMTLQDGASKLTNLLQVVTNDPLTSATIQAAAKAAVAKFRWEIMGPVYSHFFGSLVRGESVTSAGDLATALANKLNAKVALNSELAESPGDNAANPESTTTRMMATISDAADPRVQLFRPKSLRDHKEYNRQWSALRADGIEPALHGGRRATVRMLEAIELGAKIRPIAFLTTLELVDDILLPPSKLKDLPENQNVSSKMSTTAPVYVAEKDLLNVIRGQKLNVGDAVLAMVQFPIASKLEELIARPPILILENLRNAENVGSILRTAFCLGITSIVASTTAWAALKDSRAARCSMGTMYYHRYYQTTECTSPSDEDSMVSAIRQIQRSGIRVYGIEIGVDAKPITPHGSDKNWAAVMGNEDVGLSMHVGSACDQIVFIPQAHGDSLNVGHAAAIAMFELGRESPAPDHDGLAACT